jgi:hypothetical protein
VGHSKGCAKGKVYSYKCLHSENRDLSNKNLMMHLNLVEKQEQTKPQIRRWRLKIKIRAKKSETETKQAAKNQ